MKNMVRLLVVLSVVLAFVVPTASESRLSGALKQLATRDAWPAPVVELEVADPGPGAGLDVLEPVFAESAVLFELAVVHARRSPPENEEDMAQLRADDRVRYVAPLFAAGNETVAIPPEIIVRTIDDGSAEQLQAYCEVLGLTVGRLLEFTSREYLIEVPAAEPDAVFVASDLMAVGARVSDRRVGGGC